MQNLLRLSLLLLIVIYLGGCAEPENEDPTKVNYYGREFYPIKTGKSWTYAIDSSAYNKLADDTITGRYYYRAQIGSVFFENATDTTYRLEILTSDDTLSHPFKLTHVYQLTTKPLKVIITEENYPLVKLLTPFFDGQQWEGNEFNSQAGQKPFFKVSVSADKQTAVVIEQADSSCLGVAAVYSTYSKNVGLVAYSRRSIEFVQDPLNPCGLPLVVNNRALMTMRLLYTRN